MKKNGLLILIIFSTMSFLSSCRNESIRLFTGTYTVDGKNGFYLFDLDLQKGKFKLLSELEAGPSPSYFCISKKNSLIYAANETMKFKGGRGGGVTTLRYDAKNGGIEKVSEFSVLNGSPCYISLSPDEDYIFMANYNGGTISVAKLDEKGIPVTLTDTLSYIGEEGTVSHPHMISFDPFWKRIYLTDLGLDQIVIFNFDRSSGRLQQIGNGIVKLPKGAGPRHFVFSSDCTKMYVINELNSTISVFKVDTNGELTSVQTLTTLSEGFNGKSFCADIHIGKSGDFLYGSNRGENSIATFRISSDGLLTLAGRTSCGGDWPRNFAIDPSGKFIIVANQKSGNISLFSIDEKTGIPVEPGKDHKITTPACLKFSE